jgi:hypothetical protein
MKGIAATPRNISTTLVAVIAAPVREGIATFLKNPEATRCLSACACDSKGWKWSLSRLNQGDDHSCFCSRSFRGMRGMSCEL